MSTWGPNHPRGEGAAFAFFLVAMTGYATLVAYALVGLVVGW